MSRERPHPRWLWLAPVFFLGAVLGGVALARLDLRNLFGVVLVALGAVPLLWVLVSALWPARAERTCPACGGVHLERLDPRSTHGLACRGCGWRDEAASAWLLAEEEGPLEEIVLEQRGRKRRIAPVDSARKPG